MPKFTRLIDTINGPTRFGEDSNDSMRESREYNRKQFVMTRRSLSLPQRCIYDELVAVAIGNSIAAWMGTPSLTLADLGQMVKDGWMRLPTADQSVESEQDADRCT